MAGPAQPFNKGRLVLVWLGLSILLVSLGLILKTRPAPDIADQGAAPPADPQPLSFYLARADAARGQAYFQRCSVCHALSPDSARSIGPNLWGVMGQPIASRPGFAYSVALRDKGGTWDWEAANRFLQLPRYFAPGTRMTFAGVLNPQDRADVMLYLNRQGGSLAEPAGAR
jgi:cytochrome c